MIDCVEDLSRTCGDDEMFNKLPRCFLMVSFAGKMTSFTYDSVTGPTPLAIIKNGDKAMSVADILAAGDGTTQAPIILKKHQSRG